MQNVKCLNPEIMCNEKLAKERVKGLVDNLIQLYWVTPRAVYEVNTEFKRYLEKPVSKNRELFLKFNNINDRLDEFFFSKVGGLDDYPAFSKLTRMVLILFHGQAAVERGFNTNKIMLKPSLMSKSLISQKIVYDHIENEKVTHLLKA